MSTMKELEERIEKLEQYVEELVERVSYATSKIGDIKENCFKKNNSFDSLFNSDSKYRKNLW